MQRSTSQEKQSWRIHHSPSCLVSGMDPWCLCCVASSVLLLLLRPDPQRFVFLLELYRRSLPCRLFFSACVDGITCRLNAKARRRIQYSSPHSTLSAFTALNTGVVGGDPCQISNGRQMEDIRTKQTCSRETEKSCSHVLHYRNQSDAVKHDITKSLALRVLCD